MGYYTRVLTTRESCVEISTLVGALKEGGHSAAIHCDPENSPDDWEQITLTHPEGPEIASIERNLVEPGSLGEGELEEFLEDLEHAEPPSSVSWLREFFSRVRCIYAFQHLHGTEVRGGFEALTAVRTAIWSAAPAILQADGEGFSNEDGYQITWEFSDQVTGNWWMGLLRDGRWVHFQMDLGNLAHRRAFCSGVIPDGVKLA